MYEGMDAGTTAGAMMSGEPPVNGEHFLNLHLVEFSLVIPFKLTFVAGEGQFDSVSLSAVKNGEVSEPIAIVQNIPVAADQRFEIDFGAATLPGPFSPTSTDVDVDLTLIVDEVREGSFCGQIRGQVVTFSTPVTMSTFAAYPWGEEGEAPAAACTAEEVTFDPIAECPELVEGDNAFTSAELERTFKVLLPEGYDPANSYPLLFAYHGLGGSVSGLLEESQLGTATQAGGVILIVPESQGLGAEWESGLYGPTRDLAFFDDLMTCAQSSFSVDPTQVHVAGHSAGTFFSLALSLQRSEVLASSSLMSAGMSVDYRAPSVKRPMFFLWGGEEDTAYDQDFNLQTTQLIDRFAMEGHPTVYCDHSPLELDPDDSRHSWPDAASVWIVDFIKAHPQGVSPSPYAEDTPEAWMGACGFRVGE